MNKKFKTIYLILCSCCNANVSKKFKFKKHDFFKCSELNLLE